MRKDRSTFINEISHPPLIPLSLSTFSSSPSVSSFYLLNPLSNLLLIIPSAHAPLYPFSSSSSFSQSISILSPHPPLFPFSSSPFNPFLVPFSSSPIFPVSLYFLLLLLLLLLTSHPPHVLRLPRTPLPRGLTVVRCQSPAEEKRRLVGRGDPGDNWHRRAKRMTRRRTSSKTLNCPTRMHRSRPFD